MATRLVLTTASFPEVVAQATLSTAHLPQADLDVLWRRPASPMRAPFPFPLVAQDVDPDDPCFAVLYVAEDEDYDAIRARPLAERPLPCSDALWALLDAAREAGVAYLRIDRDGPVSETFPTFAGDTERPPTPLRTAEAR